VATVVLPEGNELHPAGKLTLFIKLRPIGSNPRRIHSVWRMWLYRPSSLRT